MVVKAIGRLLGIAAGTVAYALDPESLRAWHRTHNQKPYRKKQIAEINRWLQTTANYREYCKPPKAKAWMKRWRDRQGKRSRYRANAKRQFHRRRAREASAFIGDRLADAFTGWIKGKKLACHWCGEKTTNIQVDYLTALARGGKHAFKNLRTACYVCNPAKGARMSSAEFARYRRARGLVVARDDSAKRQFLMNPASYIA